MKAVLQDILDRIPEALGAAVVGLDGIPVEKLAARQSFNIDLASAEWISLAKRAAAALRSATPPGGPEEISVTSRSGLAILRSIGSLFLRVGDFSEITLQRETVAPARASGAATRPPESRR